MVEFESRNSASELVDRYVPLELDPPTQEFARNSERLILLGNTRLFVAGIGQQVTTEEKIEHYKRQGMLLKREEAMLKALGFSAGYHCSQDYDISSPEYQFGLQPHYAAEAVKAVSNGKKHIGVLIIASASSNEEIAQITADNLERDGIDVDQNFFYGQACNGLMAGVADLCRMKDFKGIEAVVVGIENLSGTYVDQQNIQMMGTFGAGVSALRFRPGVDIILHDSIGPIVERDEKGTIRTPKIYSLAEKGVQPPPWYKFIREGREIGWENAEFFAYGEDGSSCIEPFESESGIGEMYGNKVLKFFKPRMAQLLVEGEKMYNRGKYKIPLGPPAYHPASFPVIIATQRGYVLSFLRENGIDRVKYDGSIISAVGLSKMDFGERTKILEELGITPPKIDLVSNWVMRETGFNNFSSGTVGVDIARKIELGMIKPGLLIPCLTMGVWSVRQFGLLEFVIAD